MNIVKKQNHSTWKSLKMSQTLQKVVKVGFLSMSLLWNSSYASWEEWTINLSMEIIWRDPKYIYEVIWENPTEYIDGTSIEYDDNGRYIINLVDESWRMYNYSIPKTLHDRMICTRINKDHIIHAQIRYGNKVGVSDNTKLKQREFDSKKCDKIYTLGNNPLSREP